MFIGKRLECRQFRKLKPGRWGTSSDLGGGIQGGGGEKGGEFVEPNGQVGRSGI